MGSGTLTETTHSWFDPYSSMNYGSDAGGQQVTIVSTRQSDCSLCKTKSGWWGTGRFEDGTSNWTSREGTFIDDGSCNGTGTWENGSAVSEFEQHFEGYVSVLYVTRDPEATGAPEVITYEDPI